MPALSVVWISALPSVTRHLIVASVPRLRRRGGEGCHGGHQFACAASPRVPPLRHSRGGHGQGGAALHVHRPHVCPSRHEEGHARQSAFDILGSPARTGQVQGASGTSGHDRHRTVARPRPPLPHPAAMCKGVCPRRFLASMRALHRYSRCFTRGRSPDPAASWRSVCPALSSTV